MIIDSEQLNLNQLKRVLVKSAQFPPTTEEEGLTPRLVLPFLLCALFHTIYLNFKTFILLGVLFFHVHNFQENTPSILVSQKEHL